MKRGLAVLMIVMLMLPLAVMAQDDPPPEPPPEEDPIDEPVEPMPMDEPVEPEPFPEDVGITISDITGDSEAYYGQTVTVEGNIDEFINIRSFVIGETGFLTRNQLLVVNASGEELPLDVVKDIRVSVTGVVYPHFDDGGWNMFFNELAQRQPAETTVEEDVAEPEEPAEEAPDADAEEDVTEPEEPAEETPDADAEEDVTEPEEPAKEGPGDEGATEPGNPSVQEPGAVTGVEREPVEILNQYPVIVIQERFPRHTLLVVYSIDEVFRTESLEP
jgi:hypothetical protein